MSHELCEIGVFGLTSLGQSFAAHHASNKIRVCIGDDIASFVPQVIKEYKAQTEANEGNSEPRSILASRCMISSPNIEEMVPRLQPPRKIIIFGSYGQDVKFEQLYWNKLCPLLEEGDMVIRWGKEEDGAKKTLMNDEIIKDAMQLPNESVVSKLTKVQSRPKGIHLLEMVRLEQDRTVAYNGETPISYLVGGGSPDTYAQIKSYLTSSSASSISSPFAIVGHAGNDAGCVHYATMIQRAIENGITQAFAEGSHILTNAVGYEHQDIGRTFGRWNDAGGKLSSYLLKISSRIYYKRDAITKNGFVIDHIIDSMDWNGVDTWVTLEATRLGIPTPTVNAALEARFLGTMKDERVEASTILKVPEGNDTPSVLKDQITEDLQSAIYCTCLCIVAECLAVFQAAAEMESWGVNLADCIQLWNQPGSFLESTLLKHVHAALVDDPDEMRNLLTLPDIASQLQDLHMSWRRIVTVSYSSAIPIPTMSSSLTFYDSYRSRRLPISLIRAQRDFFDASGYDRNGEKGWFSTCWVKDHTLEQKKREAAALQGGESGKTPRKRKTPVKSER